MLNFIFTCAVIYMGWRFYRRIVRDFAPGTATAAMPGYRKSGEYLASLLQDIEQIAHSTDQSAEFRLVQIAEIASRQERALTRDVLPRLKNDEEYDNSSP